MSGYIKNKDILRTHGEELMSFCQERFGYREPPNLFYVTDQDNYHKLLGKTAYYDPDAKEVVVYITGRHPKDVLRSLAHELVHHTQNLNGELYSQETLGPGYAQTDSHMREMERRAYEKGNLAFRDWEDEKKIKFKGEQIMIENNLAKAVKLLVENKLKEYGTLGAGLDMTDEEILRNCPAAEGDLETAQMMIQSDKEQGMDSCNSAAADSDEFGPIAGDIPEPSSTVEESKIITPEQEESFHNRIFGTRLVALNAKLMSNFIKK